MKSKVDIAEVRCADFSLPDLPVPLDVYLHRRTTGVKETPEFAKKGLCTYAFNVGVICGHQCSYCSTGGVLFRHPLLKKIGRKPSEKGYAVIDPNPLDRIQQGTKTLTDRDVIQVCTLDDAWSPEARKYNVGRQVLGWLIQNTPSQIRILTKSHHVIDDFDVVPKDQRRRVIVGLSTGIPAGREDVAAAIEPNASSIKDRLRALAEARDQGFRTFGMLCPCPPLVSDSMEALYEMFHSVIACDVEDIWLEAVNMRGGNLGEMRNALYKAGLDREAEALSPMIGGRNNKAAGENASRYTVELTEKAIQVAKKKGVLEKLHVLTYESSLTAPDALKLKAGGYGREIVWLKKKKKKKA